MNQSLSFDGKTYISVSRASKKFGYTADYVGQLCRAGKIDARMIGRTWYVEWESIKNHKKTKKHRIRRTAEEIRRERDLAAGIVFSKEAETISGNNLLEDDELVKVKANIKSDDCPPEEYLAKVDAEIKRDSVNKISEEIITEPISNLIPLSAVIENRTEDKIEIHHAPIDQKQIDEALPITYSYDVQNDWLPKLSKKIEITPELSKHVNVVPRYNPMLALTLALFIFLNLTFVGISLMSPKLSSYPLVQNIEESLGVLGKDGVLAINTDGTNTENLSSIYGGIGNAWNSFFGSIQTKINKFAVRYMDSLGFARKTNNEVSVDPKTPITQGLVVMPDDKNHDAKVLSIKKTFSDEVEIKEDPDSQSGVIIPRFREADGEGYTYVLIPIDSP